MIEKRLCNLSKNEEVLNNIKGFYQNALNKSNLGTCSFVLVSKCQEVCPIILFAQQHSYVYTTQLLHVPKCDKRHVRDQPKKLSNATSNAIKSLTISEHLVKNPVCGNIYSKMRFKY